MTDTNYRLSYFLTVLMVWCDCKTRLICFALSVGIDFGFHRRCRPPASLESLADQWIHLSTAIAAIIVAISSVAELAALGSTVTAAIEGSGEDAVVASAAIEPVSAMLAAGLAIRPASTFAAKQEEVGTFWL